VKIYYLDGRVRSHLGKTALVLSAHEADISRLTPRGTPRVLDAPVILASGGISSISSEEHSMVKSGSAGGVVEHTARVELEALLVGLDGDGHRSNVDSGHERGLRLGNIVVGGDGGTNGLAGLAVAILGGVGVSSLGGDSLRGHDPLEGRVHESSVASIVTIGTRAVNELLLGQGYEVVLLDGPSTLDGSSGGESPA